MKWNERLYCTQSYHIIRNHGHPQKINKKMFYEKNCGNQKNRKCRWLQESAKNITLQHEKKMSETDRKEINRLNQLIQQKDKEIRLLNEKNTGLLAKNRELDEKYKRLMKKLMNLKTEVE